MTMRPRVPTAAARPAERLPCIAATMLPPCFARRTERHRATSARPAAGRSFWPVLRCGQDSGPSVSWNLLFEAAVESAELLPGAERTDARDPTVPAGERADFGNALLFDVKPTYE